MMEEKKRSRRRRGRKRGVLTAALLLLLSFSTIGGTVAYIMTTTPAIKNTFGVASVDCKVMESYNSTSAEKTAVHVKNTGTADAYIRVKLVANWYGYDSDTIVAMAAWSPTASVKTANGWTLGADGYYYYTEPVASEGVTKNLIDQITLKMDDATRYRQVLEIFAEAIQADGVEFAKGESDPERYPVVQAWKSGVSGIDDSGNLIVKMSGGGSS